MLGMHLKSSLCVLLIVLLYCCGGDSGKNPVDAGDNGNGNGTQPNGEINTGDQAFLSDDDFTLLVSADNLFDRLSETTDRVTARQELVDSLNTWESLSDVTLWEDGSTISVRFSTGDIGLITTHDPDELGGSTYAAPQPAQMHQSIPAGGIFKPAESISIPDTSSVLILVVADDLINSFAHSWTLKNTFRDAGWTNSEVNIIRAEGPESDTITPETLVSELAHYGIVFIVAHGLYGRPYPTIFAQHYIQFAYNYERPYWAAYKDQLQQWVNEWKILPSGDYLYMRQDLLEELMTDLPGSIVYLSTCWGYYARNAFLNNGANAVFSWDHVTKATDAFDNAEFIAQRMSMLKPAPSDNEAFSDPAIHDFSVNSRGVSAGFYLENNDSNNYYPGWIDFTINDAILPYETAGYSIDVSQPFYNDPQYVENDGSGYIPYRYIVPGVRNIYFILKDEDDNAILYISREENLRAGLYEVDLTLANMTVPAQWVRYTYEDGFNGYGPYTTDYFRYFCFPVIPDVPTLYTYYHDDKSGFVSSWASSMPYQNNEDLHTSEDIIQMWGKDIFSVGSNTVVEYKQVSHYGSHRGEDTISDFIAKADSLMAESTPYIWYDVYYVEPK